MGPVRTIAEDAAAVFAESSDADAGAEIAPPSLLTCVGADDVDETSASVSAAPATAVLEDESAIDGHAELEPYSDADIQVRNKPLDAYAVYCSGLGSTRDLCAVALSGYHAHTV